MLDHANQAERSLSKRLKGIPWSGELAKELRSPLREQGEGPALGSGVLEVQGHWYERGRCPALRPPDG